MTPTEFTKAAARTRLQERALAMARLVLIDGKTQAQAAREHGVTREAARMAVARIEREHKAALGVPDDWRVVTVTVPRERADEIRAIEADELRRAGLMSTGFY